MKDELTYRTVLAVGTAMELGGRARRWIRRHDRAITNVAFVAIALSARRNAR